MFGYTILVALLILNVWMTRRVQQAPKEHLPHKRLLVAGVWLMPFVGALAARNHLRLHVPGEAYRRKASRWTEHVVPEAAPARVAVAESEWSIAEHLGVIGGVPIPDWDAMERWRASIEREDLRQQALEVARKAWLLHVRDALGPKFTLHQSSGVWLVSALEPALLTATDDFIIQTRQRIARLLGRLSAPLLQRTILLVLESEEAFSHYAAATAGHAMDERQNARFIDAGCPHFVVTRADLRAVEPVIVHQLTRDMLSHRRLPRWLHEGLALHAEHQLAGTAWHSEIPIGTHQEFWNEEQIQGLWSGALFELQDDAGALACDLAGLLVGRLSAEWEAFENFVLHARADDAGAAAARDHLGIDPGAYVCALIGYEPSMAWSPRAASFV